MTEKSRQKFKYLENGQSIYNEIKSISYQMKQIKQIFFILIFLILIYKRFVLAIAVFRASWRVQEVTSEKEVLQHQPKSSFAKTTHICDRPFEKIYIDNLSTIHRSLPFNVDK